MTFGAVLHKVLWWDFSFSILGHGIITILAPDPVYELRLSILYSDLIGSSLCTPVFPPLRKITRFMVSLISQ